MVFDNLKYISTESWQNTSFLATAAFMLSLFTAMTYKMTLSVCWFHCLVPLVGPVGFSNTRVSTA